MEMCYFLGLTLIKVFHCKEELTLFCMFTRFCCFKKQGK